MLPSFAEAYSDPVHDPISWEGGSHGALLIHGYPGTPAEMRPFAEQLHERGWSVSAPLLPGFGKEIDTLADRQHEEWIAAVVDAYEQLRSQTEKTVIVGYSMGGALALIAAAQERPDALVLLAPFWEIDHVLWKTLPMLKIIMPKVKPFRLFNPNFDDPNLREGIAQFAPEADLDDPETREAIRDFEVPVGMFNQVRLLGQKGHQAAAKIQSKALVLQGKADDIVQPNKTESLISRFQIKPTYQLLDATHQLLDTSEPAWESVETAVLNFAQQIEEPAAV